MRYTIYVSIAVTLVMLVSPNEHWFMTWIRTIRFFACLYFQFSSLIFTFITFHHFFNFHHIFNCHHFSCSFELMWWPVMMSNVWCLMYDNCWRLLNVWCRIALSSRWTRDAGFRFHPVVWLSNGLFLFGWLPPLASSKGVLCRGWAWVSHEFNSKKPYHLSPVRPACCVRQHISLSMPRGTSEGLAALWCWWTWWKSRHSYNVTWAYLELNIDLLVVP